MRSKDNDSFWKSWRTRFCSNNVKPTTLRNGKTGYDIQHEFTECYKNVFKPNTVGSDEKFQTELDSLMSMYMQSTCHAAHRIDIVDLSTLIIRLKRHKAAGLDGIVSEHIINGGDQLYVHVCMLFNALLAHSFVPSDFCTGILYLYSKVNTVMRHA